MDLLRLILLQDYAARVTTLGVTLLGLAGGLVGTFLLLRKRALLGDALSHATFPGICLAFIVGDLISGDGKSLPLLLIGAAMAGLVGVGCMLAIRHLTKLKEDAALGIVLGCFFGLGVVLRDIVNSGDFGDAAGLMRFLEGSPAALLGRDAWLMAGVLAAIVTACLLLFKELRLLCFDAAYARTQGWSVVLLDILLMSLVTLVVIVGLQAVGLVLVIAMLVIPPAAARFWTRDLGRTCLISAGVGAVSGYGGAVLSAYAAGWPAGASIVLAAAVVFTASMIFGFDRGLVIRGVRRRHLSQRVAADNLLRGVYELSESTGGEGPVTLDRLFHLRSWTRRQLNWSIRQAVWQSLATTTPEGVRLTPEGHREAKRVVRNHRLWETYMIRHADVAANHVDRGADLIEHVLGDELVKQLENSLKRA